MVLNEESLAVLGERISASKYERLRWIVIGFPADVTSQFKPD